MIFYLWNICHDMSMPIGIPLCYKPPYYNPMLFIIAFIVWLSFGFMMSTKKQKIYISWFTVYTVEYNPINYQI